MKVLLITDNHLCQYSSISRSRGKKYSYKLENQIQTFSWVKQVAEEEGVQLIAHLGDFFDKSTLNAEELTALKEIEWPNIPIKFLVGNHEMATSDLSINSVNVLSKIGEIIAKPTIECVDGCEIVYLPYILESDRRPLKDYITDLREDYYADVSSQQECKRRVIFSHNDICGIRYGQYESKIGFSVDEIEQNCDLFVNGHLHNQTQIGKSILNLGNVTGLNFSEDASKYSHCVGILDTDTLQVRLINNPYAMNFYKFEIKTDSDIGCLDTCLENSFLSIKVAEELVGEVRERLKNNSNVVEYRVVVVPTVTSRPKQDIQEIVKRDHIQQFKEYVVNQLGNTEIVSDELSRL